MNKKVILPFLFLGTVLWSQNFKIIPLGVYGGLDESNLSAYLISDNQNDKYLSLDAGTLHSGLKVYMKRNKIKGSAEQFLRDNVKGYFISHPHFDHSSGLVINSPDDTKKNIYGADFVIETLKKHHFSWETWANFGNEGEQPILGKYTYKRLTEKEWIKVENTNLLIQMHYLSHTGKNMSSGVLVKNYMDNYFLYLGDTGADRIEKTNQLKEVWTYISPLIQEKKLKGIAIECSYSNEQAENQLYGHLTPRLLIEEIARLEEISGKGSLKGLNLIITHIKPKKDIHKKVKDELNLLQQKGIKIIFAEQGKQINL